VRAEFSNLLGRLAVSQLDRRVVSEIRTQRQNGTNKTGLRVSNNNNNNNNNKININNNQQQQQQPTTSSSTASATTTTTKET
jgi:hypothetical protein